MTTETDLVNTALRLVGGTRISSLDGSEENAIKANDIYEEVRDDLLRSHPWNFATSRKKLAQSATDPAFGFDHAYPVPDDWLRTISVHGNDEGQGTTLYKTEIVNDQVCIVTSIDEVWIRYIFKQTDPNRMAADFRKALEYRLAANLAIPIANSNTLEEQLTKRAERALARARSSDGMGGFPEQRPLGSWRMSRGGLRPLPRVTETT